MIEVMEQIENIDIGDEKMNTINTIYLRAPLKIE